MPAKKANKTSKKTATRTATSKKKTAKQAKPAAAKPKTKTKTSPSAARKAKTTTKKKTAAKQASAKTTQKTGTPKTGSQKKASKASKSAKLRKDVVPWSQRFKDEALGPWTCPKCGPLTLRAQPLYGEDERHHCPNLDCDAVVTLLSKEDLEPTERRGSWPPQRNKNKPANKA